MCREDQPEVYPGQVPGCGGILVNCRKMQGIQVHVDDLYIFRA